MLSRVLGAALVAMGMVAAAAHAEDLNVETARLERLSHASKLTSADARRLAEIYFLTSRCEDVKGLLKTRLTDDTRELSCACGGRCVSGSRTAKLFRLRTALAHASRFEEKPLQAIWREVSRLPEAQYLMLHYLNSSSRAYREAGLRQLRGELEKNLESLEVKP